MQPGDRVWVERVIDVDYGDGYIRVNRVGEEHASDALPDSPALPAVARWLSEPGSAEALHAIGGFMRVIDVFTSELRVVATGSGHETRFAEALEIMGCAVTDAQRDQFAALVAALTQETGG